MSLDVTLYSKCSPEELQAAVLDWVSVDAVGATLDMGKAISAPDYALEIIAEAGGGFDGLPSSRINVRIDKEKIDVQYDAMRRLRDHLLAGQDDQAILLLNGETIMA